MDKAAIIAYINEELDLWGEVVTTALRANLAKGRRFRATGSLMNSIAYELLNQGADNIGTFILGFKPYGRFIDMKKVAPPNALLVKQMEAWVQQIGIEKFKIKNKRSGRKPNAAADSAKIINELAWAIAIAKQRGTSRTRRKSWYAKTFYGLLNKLTTDLLGGLSQEAIAFLRSAAFNDTTIKI